MEKREYKRVSEKLNIDFFYGNEMYEGTVMNLSCSGLQVEAEICPSIGSDLIIVLILGDEVYKLGGKVTRTVNSSGSGCSIALSLSTKSDNYCDFVAIVKEFFYQKK